MKSIKIRIIAIVVGVLLLIPYPTVLVPEWSLRIVTQDGSPIQNTSVEQTCYHYSYSTENICAEASDARQRTDDNGFVHFSSKVVWFGALSRVIRSAYSYILLAFHGSVGISATLFIHSEFELDPSIINLDKGPPSDGIIVVRKE